MSGRATRAELAELHRLLVRNVRRRLSDPGASVELLSVARKLAADSGIGADTPAARAKLKKLHTVYLEQLAQALVDAPTAALLGEVGAALRAAGVDLERTPAATRAATDLAALSLPFLPH